MKNRGRKLGIRTRVPRAGAETESRGWVMGMQQLENPLANKADLIEAISLVDSFCQLRKKENSDRFWLVPQKLFIVLRNHLGPGLC